MSTEFVVEPEKLDSLLPLLGKRVNDDGYIVDAETGELVESVDGEHLHIDEIGYIGHGSVEPVKDDISCIVSYLSDELPNEGPE